jgi:acetyltransferase-like isoleucine patch superfamily enzyme
MNTANLFKRITYNLFLSSLNSIYRNYFKTRRSKFGYIDKSARVRFPILIKGIENVFLYENTLILGESKILATKARFVMKRNSAASEGLTVVTGNHPYSKGEPFITKAAADVQIAKEVIVEEDVVLYSNVTLLAGIVIGRGSVIGSGSVCRCSIPPYAIVVGNPAKVIGFKLFPKQIIEHEKVLYSENERLSLEYLQKNYYKYFTSRLSEISSFISI